MTDDLTAALRDLADSADLTAPSPPVVRAAAHARRRRRRLVAGATAAAVVLLAPVAWSAAPGPGTDAVVEDTAGAPEPELPASAPTGRMLSGTFELTYDSQRYDDRSDAALSSCDALPGLLTTGFELDSLPPIRGFHFAGSASEQEAATRCLEAMPAAIVAFEQDAFFVPVVVRGTDLQGPGRLSVSTSPLRPSAGGWLEHDLTLSNAGTEPVVVDLEGLAEVMGGSVAVSTGSCSAIAAPGGSFACEFAKRDRVVDPGESAVTTVELERDVEGLADVQPGPSSLTWTQPVRDPEGRPLGDLTLALDYVVLTAALAPSLAEVPRPPGETQTVQVYFGSTAPDAEPCQDVRAVPRQVPVTAAVATAALGELFAGPTPEEEQRYDVASAFSRATADLLRSVHLEEGTAYVDLRPFEQVGGGAHALGSYSTSCGSVAFHSSVRATLQQFPTVREVRYAFDGDPRAFVEYMQGGCPDPVPAGDPCDPEPFR